jgi:putative addiction module killer protein
MVITLKQYIERSGRNPFEEWFDALDAQAFAKVTTALTRLQEGNFSNVKGVGGGVFERKIDFGPGYRVYFGKDGEAIIILLAGGTKKRQNADIADAIERWKEYKQRKTKER